MPAEDRQDLIPRTSDDDEKQQSEPGCTPQLPTVTQSQRARAHQLISCLIATVGAFSIGTIVGWSGPVGPRITTGREYGFFVNEEECMWIESLIALGAAFMSFPAGCLMDRIGRKAALMLLTFPLLLGWLLVLLAINVDMLYSGRFVLGVAIGGICVVTPAYISEIAQDSIRGSLGTLFQLSITLGILFSFTVGGFYNIYLLNVLCSVVPLLYVVLLHFIPESPYYLARINHMDRLKKALTWLRCSQNEVQLETARILNNLRISRRNPVNIRQSLSKISSKKAIAICLSLMALQQVSGINAMLFNITNIFDLAKVNLSSNISTVIIGFMQFVATFLSSLWIEKLGRRVLLLSSCLIIFISESLLAVYFYLLEKGHVSQQIMDEFSWLPVLSLCLFIIAFSFGLGPIPWLMSGELCSNDIKAYANSISSTSNWWIAFVISATFDQMRIEMGAYGTFGLFAGCVLIGLVYIYFFVPETKGKSIEEIQRMLEETN